MPAIYVHYLFGQKVFHLLSGDISEIIKEHEEAFQIGLQGPDIFFYYHPLSKNRFNEMARFLHKGSAKLFFEHAKEVFKYTDNKETLAYLLGFLCHFILDSESHPYINDCGVSHIVLETEFDKLLLQENTPNFLKYQRHLCIASKKQIGKDIFLLYGGTNAEHVNKVIRSMRFYNKLLYSPSGLKLNLLSFLEKASHIKEQFCDLAVKKGDIIFLSQINSLKAIFDNSLVLAEEQIVLLYDYLNDEKEISLRLDRNFE